MVTVRTGHMLDGFIKKKIFELKCNEENDPSMGIAVESLWQVQGIASRKVLRLP